MKSHGLGNRFVNGPKENRVTPIQKSCFCTRSLGKQRKSMRHLHFCNGPSENKGNPLTIMVWEIVFVNGPEKNTVKPILKCCFCTRSFGKQRKSMRSMQFLSKQRKPIEKSWFGKFARNLESVTYGFLIRNLRRNKNGWLRLIEWISGVLFITKSIRL